MSTYRKLSAILLATAIVGLPLALWWTLRLSPGEIDKAKIVEVGEVSPERGQSITVHAMVGDVFAPKKIYPDLGFDIASFSCYFDPVRIPNQGYQLPRNPLLNSAIQHSFHQRDTTEVRRLYHNLIETLNKSRLVAKRFREGRAIGGLAAEGEEITPHVWPVRWTGEDRGVKYMAALPLFDPAPLTGRVSAPVIRSRLAQNVEEAVERLVNEARRLSGIRTIGFAALGSTSHKAGDSKMFLRFRQGFLSIVRGLKKSEPPAALDDVYLVAYSQHRGQYREDALDGLQVVSERVLARDMASGRFAAFISSILGFFFFLFGLVIDSDIESFPQDVRLEDVQNAKGLLFGFGGLWWGTGEATRLFGANPFEMAPLSVLGLYAGLALCALLLVRWLYRSSPDPFDPSDFRQG